MSCLKLNASNVLRTIMLMCCSYLNQVQFELMCFLVTL